ncbi:UNVERIFIED_CONTAM: ABC transporter ATP-binding protein, partial [Bacillus sp. ATCC 13368]
KHHGRKSVEAISIKKKDSRSFAEIENELMHIEEDIYALESEMEYVADVERLEKLYEEKTKKELLRADLYNELENMVE